MTVSVHVGGQQYLLSLRKALAWWLFDSLMVFETKAGMREFAAQLRGRHARGQLEPKTKMLALDGSSVNLQAGVETDAPPVGASVISSLV